MAQDDIIRDYYGPSNAGRFADVDPFSRRMACRVGAKKGRAIY